MNSATEIETLMHPLIDPKPYTEAHRSPSFRLFLAESVADPLADALSPLIKPGARVPLISAISGIVKDLGVGFLDFGVVLKKKGVAIVRDIIPCSHLQCEITKPHFGLLLGVTWRF